jgi:hypothetical protein
MAVHTLLIIREGFGLIGLVVRQTINKVTTIYEHFYFTYIYPASASLAKTVFFERIASLYPCVRIGGIRCSVACGEQLCRLDFFGSFCVQGKKNGACVMVRRRAFG